MDILRSAVRLAVVLLLAVAFAFALFISATSLGRPIGPVETVVVWAVTGLLGWATLRRWQSIRPQHHS